MFVQPLFSKKKQIQLEKDCNKKTFPSGKGFLLINRSYNRHPAWLLLHREGNHFRLERRSRG